MPRWSRVSWTLFLYDALAVPLLCSVPSCSCRPFHPFFSFIDGFVLLLVVLAGLLPQFATIVIRFTETSLNLTTLQRSQVRYVLSQLSPSIFIGQSVTWSLVIQYSVGVFQVMQTYPISFITSGVLPLRTINMRALGFRPLALD